MNFRNIFAPPLSTRDHKRNQEAIIINVTLWSIVALILLSELGNTLGGKTPLVVRILNGIFLVVTLGYISRTRKRHPKNRTNIAYLSLGLIYISIAIFFLGSVTVPTTTAYILPIVLAGFLFGKRGSYITTLIVALIIMLLIYLEVTGRLMPTRMEPGITQWVSYTAFFAIISNIIFVAMNVLRRYWSRAEREIKRRKKTEKVLALYSHAIRHSPAAIIISDSQGKIERVNPKFETMTGYGEDEVIGKSPDVLSAGTYPADFYDKIWNTILAGDEWRSELQSRKKSGELYWEKVSIAPITDNAGKITHFISIHEEISEQKKAQQREKEDKQRLKEQLQEISALKEKLEEQALRDSLTGLYNRHYLDEILDKEFARSERSKKPISIILLDMDHLKKLNDIGGHATGDLALRIFAEQMMLSVRKGDTVCRYGGDEFAIVMPNTNAADAFKRAQELNERMKVLTQLHRKDQILKITFTAGVASYPQHGSTKEEIFNFADVALYRAKLKGRNQVELFSVE